VNFVGHIHIAALCVDRYGYPSSVADAGSVDRPARPSGIEPSAAVRYHLGTALPDFAAIGRFQLRNESQDPAVKTGVDVHHATDGAFHDSAWFIERSKQLSSDLRARGINRGAARACGHVGVELLLDGHLLTRSATLADQAQAVLKATVQPVLELGRLVESQHMSSWAQHLKRIGSWTLPTDYDQPRSVAERLQRILSHRPRLAFDTTQIDTVAESLHHITKPLVDGIDDIVGHVSAEVVNELT